MAVRNPQRYESLSNLYKIFIRYVINNNNSVLCGVLLASDTWMNHRTSRVKLAHVQSASNYEWLFQEIQCSVAVGVHNYTVAVASWFACKIQYVCFNRYIAIRNALLKLLIDAHMKMSMCTYAV